MSLSWPISQGFSVMSSLVLLSKENLLEGDQSFTELTEVGRARRWVGIWAISRPNERDRQ